MFDPNACGYAKTITITPEQIDAALSDEARLQLVQKLMNQENMGTTYVALLVPMLDVPHGFVDSLIREDRHPNESIPPMSIRSFYFSCVRGLQFYSYADLECECLSLAHYEQERNPRKSLHRHARCYEATVEVLRSEYHHMSDVSHPKDCELFPPGQRVSLRFSTQQIRKVDSLKNFIGHHYAGYITQCNHFYNFIPPEFAKDDGFLSQELFELCDNSSTIVTIT